MLIRLIYGEQVKYTSILPEVPEEAPEEKENTDVEPSEESEE